MKGLVLGGLFSLILSIGMLCSDAGASESRLHMFPQTSITSLGNTGPMATWGSDGWWTWLHRKLERYFSGSWNTEPRGSVPIPGTLLLFGVGFAALIAWRSRHRLY